MAREELLAYISSRLRDGASLVKVRDELVRAGWSTHEVDQVFEFIDRVRSHPPLPGRAAPAVRPRRWRRWALIIVLLAVLGLAGWWSYERFYVNAPRRVLSRMITRIEPVKTVEYAADLKLEMPPNLAIGLMMDDSAADSGLGLAPVRLAVGANGALDWRDPKNTVSWLDAGFRAIGLTEHNLISLEYRAEQGQPFFRINDSTGLEQSPLASLSGRWVKYDFQQANRRFNDSWLLELANRKDFGFAFGQLLSDLPGSGALLDLRRIGATETNGQPVWRLGATLDSRLLRSEMAKAFGQTTAAGYLDTIEVNNVEIWIGQDDDLPYRLSFDLVGGGEAEPAEADVVLLFSNFDDPVKVEACHGRVGQDDRTTVRHDLCKCLPCSMRDDDGALHVSEPPREPFLRRNGLHDQVGDRVRSLAIYGNNQTGPRVQGSAPVEEIPECILVLPQRSRCAVFRAQPLPAGAELRIEVDHRSRSLHHEQVLFPFDHAAPRRDHEPVSLRELLQKTALTTTKDLLAPVSKDLGDGTTELPFEDLVHVHESPFETVSQKRADRALSRAHEAHEVYVALHRFSLSASSKCRTSTSIPVHKPKLRRA